MLSLCVALWNDEAGFLVSAELALVSTIGVMGMVAGLSEVSNNVNAELQDVGTAYRQLNQSYNYQLHNGTGSSFQDGQGQSAAAEIGG